VRPDCSFIGYKAAGAINTVSLFMNLEKFP